MNINIMSMSKDELEGKLSGFEDCSFTYGLDNIENADAIFGNPTLEQIKLCTNLKWIQTASAGVDAYIKGGFPEGVLLTNATGSYGLAISEHMLGMHLALLKKLLLYRDQQSSGTWKSRGTVSAVRGSTVLILGMGDIGSDYAKLVKAMGAYVIGVRRSDTTKPDYVDELYLSDELENVISRADVVAIALPGTKKTAKLIDDKLIEKMKDNAIVLNVGRGNIIDTDALCNALESKKLGGAGLDVTDPEPLPSEHRLWKIETALITPHVSGGFHLKETRERLIEIFKHNLDCLKSGKTLKNIVDFNEGYRKL